MTESPPLLFDRLPAFPIALPDDELDLLAQLPIWPMNMNIFRDADCVLVRRLERRGLVKTSRLGGELWAGKLQAATLRQISGEAACGCEPDEGYVCAACVSKDKDHSR